MQEIDYPTLIAATGLTHLMLAMTFSVYSKPGDIEEPAKLWMWGSLIAAASVPLFLLHSMSLGMRAVLATGVVTIGYGLQLTGVCSLLGIRRWKFRGLVATLVLSVYELNPVLIDLPNAQRITYAMAGVAAMFMLFSIAYASQWQTGSRLIRLLAVANALLALAFVGRSFDAAVATGDYSFYRPSAIQSLAYVMALIGAQLNGFGFVFALKEQADRALQRLAMLDPLTETLNRRAFLAVAELQLASASRTMSPLSVMIGDIDDFKQINDTYGHQAGDEVIKHFVSVARRILRSTDSIGRWGGEEFVLLLPNIALAGCEQVATRLNATFSAEPVIHNGQLIKATVSVGLAELKQPEGIQDAIDRADKAMYRAKERGKDRIEVADCLAIEQAKG